MLEKIIKINDETKVQDMTVEIVRFIIDNRKENELEICLDFSEVKDRTYINDLVETYEDDFHEKFAIIYSELTDADIYFSTKNTKKN